MGIAIEKLNVGQMTHVGRKREINQDYMGSFPFNAPFPGVLLIVADGMGGAKAGEVASQIAVKTISEAFLADSSPEITTRLETGIRAANKKINDQSRSGPEFKGMGTTVVAAVLTEKQLFVCHVGDSRVFLLTQESTAPIQLTEDHSWINDQVKKGLITDEEAKSHPKRKMITRALGHKPEVTIDSLVKEINTGDAVLLCSDGLTDYVSGRDIQTFLSRYPAQQACAELVNLANSRGGGDNITVVCAQTAPIKEMRAAGEVDGTRKKNFIPLAAAVFLILAGLIGYFFVQPGDDGDAGQTTVSPGKHPAIESIEMVEIEPGLPDGGPETNDHLKIMIDEAFGTTKHTETASQLRSNLMSYLSAADEGNSSEIIAYVTMSAMKKKPFDVEDLSVLRFLLAYSTKEKLTDRDTLSRLRSCIDLKKQAVEDVARPGTRETFGLTEDGNVSFKRRISITTGDYLESNWWKLQLPHRGRLEFQFDGSSASLVELSVFSLEHGQLELEEAPGEVSGKLYRAQVEDEEKLYVKISPVKPDPGSLDACEFTISYQANAYE